MANCVWSTDEEVKRMRDNDVFIAHCPASNMNLSSGIAPVRKYLDMDMRIGLGSDVAGGQTESMFRAITDAIQVSKMYRRYIDENANTILVSYARSGNSPESVGTYDLFEKKVKNLAHIVVTCNKEGELAKKSQEKEGNLVLIMPEKSNDKSFAMTSSFTCMTLATLLLFDIANLEKNKKIVEELATKGQASLDNQWKDAKAISDLGAERIVYVGSGALKGLCHEMALKNLELTSGKQVTVCESILGFRHGPKSIINNNTLVIFLCSTNDYTALYDYDLIKEVYNDEGTQKVAVLNYFDRENLKEISHKYITANGSKLDDTFIAFNYIIFGQMISFFNSLRLGISPDNPRPDGTVNRVVQGVIIHEYNN